MILVDTSVWIEIMRDKTGKVVLAFQEKTRNHMVCLSRFNQLELLQGALNEKEWGLLEDPISISTLNGKI